MAAVLGAGAGAGAALVATGKVGGEPSDVSRISLPPDRLGAFLPGVSLESVSGDLEGFACGPRSPGLTDHPATFHGCVLELEAENARIDVGIAGRDEESILAITTTLETNGVASSAPLIPRWAEVATAFEYEGASPRLARRWALAAPATKGTTAVGDAYLVLDPDTRGNYVLQIRARADWKQRSDPPPTHAELAERFAPILRLSDQAGDPEPYEPISIETFVGTASLMKFSVVRYSIAKRELVREFATVADLARPRPRCARGFRTCYYALDLRNHVRREDLSPLRPAGYAELQARLPRERTVYWNAADDDGGTTIQYWFLYLFNDFSVNRHEADWEHIAVRLDRNHVPVAVFLSSHHGGSAKPWVALTEGLSRLGDHPIVSVARGSHANYFGTGAHAIRECHARVCASGLDFVSTDVREIRAGQEYALKRLEGSAFDGLYGTGNFLFRGRFLVSLEKPDVADPRGRKEWRRALSEFVGAPLAP